SRGFDALGALASSTVDLDSRRLAALRSVIPEVMLESDLTALAAAAVEGGGWGFDAGRSTANALDTAVAMAGLVPARALGVGPVLAALAALAVLQGAAGGFSQAPGEPSDVGTTAEVLTTLGAVGVVTNVSGLRDRAAGFLTGSINPDGGFPG